MKQPYDQADDALGLIRRNHPTQGLQDMTLDLSTYSAEALAELQTRIEEEKTKRELKVLFDVRYHSSNDGYRSSEGKTEVIVSSDKFKDKNLLNLYHRLTAEEKLRAAGGKKFERKKNDYALVRHASGDVWSMPGLWAIYGDLHFDTPEKAEAAYATLTPDEQSAIFNFGE